MSGEANSPAQQRAQLERMKFTMEQLPDLGVPIHPPLNLGPKEIIIPRAPVPPTLGRYLVASDGGWLTIVDTQYGRIFARSAEIHREHVEELIRLANRPE